MKKFLFFLLTSSLALASSIGPIGGGSSAAVWGGITGTLSDQTDLQGALDLKAPLASPTFTGAIGTALTASRALATDGSGRLAVSSVTATELGYVAGVTSAIQTQLGLLAPLASPTFTGTAALASATVSGSLKSGNYHIEPGENNAGNSSTAQTINWSTGSAQLSTLTGSVTYTFSNPVAGGAYVLRIATGAGSFTATWPASVKWAGGTAPTITATASKVDLINFYYDGTNYYGSFTQNY